MSQGSVAQEATRDLPKVGQVFRRGNRVRKVTGISEFRGPYIHYQSPWEEKKRIEHMVRPQLWNRWVASAEMVAGEADPAIQSLEKPVGRKRNRRKG